MFREVRNIVLTVLAGFFSIALAVGFVILVVAVVLH
jgi:hypothetical protein